jgi:vacuolar-type H+-ATPase subunit E/Vma4
MTKINTTRAAKSTTTAAKAIEEVLTPAATTLAGMSDELKRTLLAELLSQKELVKEVSENPEVKASLAQAAAQLAEDGSVRNVAVAQGLGEDPNIGALVDWMETTKAGMVYLGATFDISTGSGITCRGAIRLQVSDKKAKADSTLIERTKVWAVKSALASLAIKI